MICKYGAMVKASAAAARKWRFRRHFVRKNIDRGKPATVAAPTPRGAALHAASRRGGLSARYQLWGTIELASWEATTRPVVGRGAPERSNSMRRSNAVERIIG